MIHILHIVINNQMRVALNYPRAAAMSLILLLIVLAVVYLTDLVTRFRRVA
jgi:ABC-type spermidine/putrescine transport system permease subunit I